MSKLPKNVSELLEDSVDDFSKVQNQEKDWVMVMENKQPNEFSWLTIEVISSDLATDSFTAMYYQNPAEFRAELKKYIDAHFSDELLEHLFNKRIDDIRVNVGPHPFCGGNLNDPESIH